MGNGMNIEQLLTYGVSWSFLILAVWGTVAFFPRKKERGDTGPAWLILAIWCGFVGAGLNVFYWRVFGDAAVYFGWFTVHEIRWFGNSYGDMVWKGLGAVSIYLHFYARWKFLSADERKSWTPMLMGWYPNDSSWFVRVTLRTWRKSRNKEKAETDE